MSAALQRVRSRSRIAGGWQLKLPLAVEIDEALMRRPPQTRESWPDHDGMRSGWLELKPTVLIRDPRLT